MFISCCKKCVALTFAVVVAMAAVFAADAPSGWQTLSPGMEIKYFKATQSSIVGDSRIAVLRMDPHLWELEFAGASQTGEGATHTAREWCEKRKFTAAINAGMFLGDGKTHLGYMRFREHVNNSRANPYQSVAAFDPRDGALPRFRIFDLDAPGVTLQNILRDYASAAQNLRLVKHPGSNQWSQQSKQWSEAALGEDSAGRILFIYSRSPFSMHDLIQELLASGIGLVAAQHLEGGPEAQLYLQAGGTELEMFGSYETSFRANDDNGAAWPVPNVLGVRPRSSGH
jgi:hypothetical protein